MILCTFLRVNTTFDMLDNICHVLTDIPLSDNPFNEMSLKETLFNIFDLYDYIDIDRYMTPSGNMI